MLEGYTPKGRMIELTQDELSKAKEVGDGRNAANAQSKDKPYYDRDRMQDDATASFAAAAAECAVAKAFGVEWHGKVWAASEHWLHANEPDAGERIEVKRIRNPKNGLVIRPKDVELGHYVVLAYPLPESGFKFVDVIGWISAADGWAIGWDSGRGYKRVSQEHLHNIPKEVTR
jgi:hypothetical protein